MSHSQDLNSILTSISAIMNDGNAQTPSELFTNILNEFSPAMYIDEVGSSDSSESLNSLFEHDTSKYRNVLSTTGHELLEKKLYNIDECGDTSCPISLKEFNEDMEIIVLPCKHCFVEEAIMKWLTTMNAVCPICRYELPSKEERIANGVGANGVGANGVGANGVGANGDNENIPLGDGLVTMQSVFRNMMQRAAERQYNTEQNDMQEAILASMSSFDCDD
jgi:hypothetical protein